MWLSLVLAYADPPIVVPNWGIGPAAPEAADDVSASVAVRWIAPAVDGTPVPLDAVSPPRHAWSSVDALTVDVSGDARRLYYLMATARTANVVAHWQQGPYAFADETAAVAIELPPEIVASVSALGVGHLMVHVASATAGGRVFPRESVGQTVLTAEGGRVVGLPRARWADAQLEVAHVDDPNTIEAGAAVGGVR